MKATETVNILGVFTRTSCFLLPLKFRNERFDDFITCSESTRTEFKQTEENANRTGRPNESQQNKAWGVNLSNRHHNCSIGYKSVYKLLEMKVE